MILARRGLEGQHQALQGALGEPLAILKGSVTEERKGQAGFPGAGIQADGIEEMV